MSIAESQPHTAALMTKLRTDLPIAIGLALGVGPVQTGGPYVAVYPSSGVADDLYLCGDRSKFEMRVFVHCIGDGPDQAQWVFDQVRNSLLGTPPPVTGRSSYRMYQETGTPSVYRDTTVQPPVYIQAGSFEWCTGP